VLGVVDADLLTDPDPHAANSWEEPDRLGVSSDAALVDVTDGDTGWWFRLTRSWCAP
jgi:hypothetical protein